MAIFLILPLLLGNFVLKETIPYGTSGPRGRVLCGDFNRNNLTDVIFTGYSGTYAMGMVFERQDSGVYVLMDTVGFYLGVWDVGDFDADGFYDLVTDGSDFIGLSVFESPDSFSYPTQEVWRDTVGQPLVAAISAHDVDQDMLPEIIDNNGNGQPHWIWVYESTGNNQYDTICTFNPMIDTVEHCFNSTHAFGDFDGDGNVEFIAGDLDGYYWVFESSNNNAYEQIHQGYLSTGNIKDCFAVPDADGDGKLEFVVKGFAILAAEIHAFIFEATGDNTYEIVKSFTLWGGDYYGGYSDVGDVDGDSIPEVVLEGRQTVHIIKTAGNDSFYVWETLPGNSGGSNVRVYDVDGNGLCEVIISGNNETRIYEYQVGIEEGSELRNPVRAIEIHSNPFKNTLNIRLNSQFTGEIAANVYDVSGRLIKNIYSGSTDGCNVLTWYGDDNNGRQVPQGIYFIRIERFNSDQSFYEKIIKTQ